MDATARVEHALRAAGATGALYRFTEQVPTAVAAAQALECEVGAIANSLVFAAGDEPVLVVASGAHRVDTVRAARLLGVDKLKRATPEFVLAATGQPVGGVAPVGHPAPIRTLIDEWLAKYDVVWAGGGDKFTMFPTSFDELVRLTGGTPADVGA